MVQCVLNKDIEDQIKDLLRITKELTFWGDGFPGEKITFENQIFLLLSIVHISKLYLHFEIIIFMASCNLIINLQS